MNYPLYIFIIFKYDILKFKYIATIFKLKYNRYLRYAHITNDKKLDFDMTDIDYENDVIHLIPHSYFYEIINNNITYNRRQIYHAEYFDEETFKKEILDVYT